MGKKVRISEKSVELVPPPVASLRWHLNQSSEEVGGEEMLLQELQVPEFLSSVFG